MNQNDDVDGGGVFTASEKSKSVGSSLPRSPLINNSVVSRFIIVSSRDLQGNLLHYKAIILFYNKKSF